MIPFHQLSLQVVGVKWVSTSGKPTETRAALFVLDDGYFSILNMVLLLQARAQPTSSTCALAPYLGPQAANAVIGFPTH